MSKTIKVHDAPISVGKLVTVSGWVQVLRRAGGKKNPFCFILLRDGTYLSTTVGILQCVVQGYPEVTRESTVRLTGTIAIDAKRAPGGYEMRVAEDGFELIHKSENDDIEAVMSLDATVPTRMDARGTMMRLPIIRDALYLRSMIERFLRRFLEDRDYIEVRPPTLTKTKCEGGSELFTVDYFGEKVYLVQSSQMPLEPAAAALGNVFTIQSSYRAEKTRTRRHLTEYTHLEAELTFITFEDLLQAIEDLIVGVITKLLSEHGDLVQQLRAKQTPALPPLVIPETPFRRMTYRAAIEYCRDHEIYKDKEKRTFFQFGDDIPSGPEREMIDQIGEPVMLTGFPPEMKSFYMQLDPDDPTATESVDLLLPGVGEIVGGSMRMDDYDELFKSMQDRGMPIEEYHWYLDCRKFGSFKHGGYGLGVERLVMALLGLPHIREACLFPRYMGRCTPG